MPLAAFAAPTTVAADTVDVVYGLYADVEDLDPHVAGGGITDHIVTIAIFDPLIWDFDASKPDGERSGLRPMLATSWEVIDDLRWRLTLREGVTFHNGAPFDAEAVKYSLERPHASDFQTGDKIIDVAISHVEIIDDYTVDVVTSEPVPILPERLTRNGAFVLEPGHYADLSPEEASRNPVGTGPFKLVSWDRDQRIVLERNEDYWGPQPNFDRLVFRIVPEPATMLVEALTGEIDIAPISADMVDEVDASEGVHVVAGDSLVRATLIVNLEAHEALADKRVRQAMAWAVDTDALIEAYALGQVEPSITMVNPPNHHSGLEPYGYDPEKAKALLAEAGWEDGFQIELDVAHPDALDWAEGAAFYLTEAGIEITAVNMLARSVFVERLNQRTLNVHAHHWSAGENTPETDMWATHPDRPTNSTNWYNQEWVDLYSELTTTVDPERRQEINHRMQEILYDELPWIVQYTIPLIKVVSDRIEGYHPHPSFLVEDYANIRVLN